MPQPSLQKNKQPPIGFGQLSLVEHSLCPLHKQSSLVENFVHNSKYRYSNAQRKRHTAHARIFCPLGLSASDEFYLWGLLALTLSQPGDRSDLVATPHWCLRRLGVVDSGSNRGGENYRLFRDALTRLSAVIYLCDAFYDPVRGEHREVSFHFFSFTLPVDPSSTRAWNLNWDQTFLELVKHGSGHLCFNLQLYRRLDPGSRRLFLFVSKIFHKKEHLPQFGLKYLALDVLGFSSTVSVRDLRIKVLRCLRLLEAEGVIRKSTITRVGKSQYVVNASRGPHFDARTKFEPIGRDLQPVLDSIIAIGFDMGAAAALIRRYPVRLLETWVDITKAKLEHKGRKSFRRSPMAYFVDSVREAHKGRRTPPDWWSEMRRAEDNQTALSVESQKLFGRIRSELFNSSSGRPTSKAATTGVSRASDVLKTAG